MRRSSSRAAAVCVGGHHASTGRHGACGAGRFFGIRNISTRCGRAVVRAVLLATHSTCGGRRAPAWTMVLSTHFTRGGRAEVCAVLLATHSTRCGRAVVRAVLLATHSTRCGGAVAVRCCPWHWEQSCGTDGHRPRRCSVLHTSHSFRGQLLVW